MLTRNRTALAFSLFMMSAPALLAQGVEAGIGGDEWDGAPLVSLHARTIFPVYMGAGVELHASQSFSLGLDFGATPKPSANESATDEIEIDRISTAPLKAAGPARRCTSFRSRWPMCWARCCWDRCSISSAAGA